MSADVSYPHLFLAGGNCFGGSRGKDGKIRTRKRFMPLGCISYKYRSLWLSKLENLKRAS